MPTFNLADRLAVLPPYLFAEIDRVKEEVRAKGMDIISLGIGDPDLPTPDFIIERLAEAARNPANHQYPSYVGLLSFRQAVADWSRERFGVELDPAAEVVSLIGSKEGIAHLPLAFINPGDLALVSEPGYPVYASSVGFCGGEVRYLPLVAENDFLPDLDAVSNDDWKRAKMIFVNYPNNPTSATAPKEYLERLVEKCLEFDTILVHDAAYSEIYYDEADKPMSILEIPGAMDVAIEFNSLSKPFNMTGWRVGMAMGNAQLVAGLGKIKENVDSGIFQAVQEAGIAALKDGGPYVAANRDIYRERRDAVVGALAKAGIACLSPKATFYVWCETPKGRTSAEFVADMLRRTGVVTTPGTGFGASGEGYFRISLTVDTDRLMEAVQRIESM